MSKRNNSGNSGNITITLNLDDMLKDMDDAEHESPVKTRGKPKVRAPPKPRKSRKKVTAFAGKIDTLADLIELARDGTLYSNINVPMLMAIESELKELNELIGLDSIKQSIYEQLLFYMQKMHQGSEMYMHTVIYGPPGTGKTTVAKLLGRMFSKMEVLEKPDYDDYDEDDDEPIFECARRDDLIGEYLGSTCNKTYEYLESCLGGVVFMDEVYSLGNKDGGDSFAKEAIDTINLFLSEHKDEFMMIIAGYKDEIDSCFFKYNEGLRRRFMWYHTIEPYTPTQLRDIFLSKVAQTNWKVAQGVAEAMVQTIRDHPDRFPDHAGSIENLITRMKIKHSKRVLLLPESEKKVLTREDLSQAMDEVNKVPKKQEFMSMYM